MILYIKLLSQWLACSKHSIKVSYIIFIMIPLPTSTISSHHLSPGVLQHILIGVSACNLLSLLHTPDTLIFLKGNFCHIIPLFKSFQWLLVTLSRYSSDYYPIISFSDTIIQHGQYVSNLNSDLKLKRQFMFALLFLFPSYLTTEIYPLPLFIQNQFYLAQLQSQNFNPLRLLWVISGYYTIDRKGHFHSQKNLILSL